MFNVVRETYICPSQNLILLFPSGRLSNVSRHGIEVNKFRLTQMTLASLHTCDSRFVRRQVGVQGRDKPSESFAIQRPAVTERLLRPQLDAPI